MNNKSILKEKAKYLPEKPGIYLMLDSLGNIIYVGKAKNLKSRVSQYFRKAKNRDPKVEEMIQYIAGFEHRVLDTELDALLEECRAIKKIKPRYNRQMKNDQKYVYIKIPAETFPRPEIVQERKEDSAIYYGPFNSRSRVETAMLYLKDNFLIRKCASPGLVKRNSGCLYQQLNTCLGVCTAGVSPEEYMVHLQALCRVIEGRDKETKKEISNQLVKAIADLDFEKAARYREYQLGLYYIQGRQKFLNSTRCNTDLLALEFLDDKKATAKIYLIKGNKLLASSVIDFARSIRDGHMPTGHNADIKQFLILAQEKLLADQGSPRLLTQQEVDEAQILDSYLRKDRVFTFRVTQRALRQDDFIEKMLERIERTFNP
ncbi:GIY-YIG nuclease family protein [Desulfitobacterium dichloroeliminans]|nr:GIY-YIG nuclease family protein [Desulfitobacterium dichloroeliminans]